MLVPKICTPLWRESDLEVKIVKAPDARSTFWGSKCISRGGRNDFDTLQNTWQAQEFVRVAKTLAGVVDLERVRNDGFRVGGAGISGFVKSMFEASDAESVEGLQISCHGSVTLQGSFRVAVTGVLMPRLNFFVAGAVLLKHPLKIIKTYCNSEVKRLVHMSFEGSLAKTIRFWVSKFHFWGKSRRKASFLSFRESFFKGSLAKTLRFWASKLHFWRKSRTETSFLNFKPSLLVFTSVGCQIYWISHQVNLKSNDWQTNWISKQLNLKPFEYHHLDLTWFELNHLNLKSTEAQSDWARNLLISNQLTTKPIKSQTKWQPIDFQINWQPNYLNFKPMESEISKQLNLKPMKSQVTWTSNPSNLKPNEMQNNWIWNQFDFRTSSIPDLLPIGSLSLETSATASWGRYVINKC